MIGLIISPAKAFVNTDFEAVFAAMFAAVFAAGVLL